MGGERETFLWERMKEWCWTCEWGREEQRGEEEEKGKEEDKMRWDEIRGRWRDTQAGMQAAHSSDIHSSLSYSVISYLTHSLLSSYLLSISIKEIMQSPITDKKQETMQWCLSRLVIVLISISLHHLIFLSSLSHFSPLSHSQRHPCLSFSAISLCSFSYSVHFPPSSIISLLLRG